MINFYALILFVCIAILLILNLLVIFTNKPSTFRDGIRKDNREHWKQVYWTASSLLLILLFTRAFGSY